MANGTALQQMALASDPTFLERIAYLLTQEALAVVAEVSTTPNHAARCNYARIVLNSPMQAAQAAAVTIAGSTNLVAANTTIVAAVPASVSTDASDASILSEVSTLWNSLAGVTT